MRKSHLLAAGAAVLVSGFAFAAPAQVAPGGCVPPDDITDITIDIDLGGETVQASGGYCEAVAEAERIIAASTLSRTERASAATILSQMQNQLIEVSRTGAAPSSRRVGGEFNCQGTASTRAGASVSCGFTIRF